MKEMKNKEVAEGTPQGNRVKNMIDGLLDNEKRSSGILTAVLIITVLIFNIAIFAIASIFNLSFTVSARDELVLTGNTDALFEDAIKEGKKVKIYFCFPTPEELEAHETGARVHKTALDFKERYKDFIEIDYLNLITRTDGSGKDISAKIQKWQYDMRRTSDMKEEESLKYKNYLAKGSVIFECGDNYKVVTDVYSSGAFADFYTLDANMEATSYNGEAYMASMIHWVTVNKHPTAYFTVGHSEQFDRAFANLLTSAGYYLDTVNLKEKNVPADADLLIIANPLSDFEKAVEGSGVRTEKERLDSYIERGGNVYVAFDPYVNKLPVLEGVLAGCGIKFSETESERGVIKNIIKDSNNAITTDGFTLVADFADNDIASAIGDTVAGYSDGNVIVRQAAALELSGSAVPLLVTTPSSVLEADGARVDSKGSYPVAACAKINVGGAKTASVCVLSSVYAAVSDALITDGYSNTDFFYSLFDNFSGQGGMPYGCEIERWENSFLENLTMGRARLYTAIIMTLPVAIAVTGTVIVYKRKYR